MSMSTVLLNPHAAGGKAAAWAEPMRHWLSQHAAQVTLEVPESAAQSRRFIDALPHGSRIVVVGGDGTLNQLLPSLLAGAHTVALVPFGSGNDTARALGLYGLLWQQALHHGLHGPASRIDVGLADLILKKQTMQHPWVKKNAAFLSSQVSPPALTLPLACVH